MQGDLPAWALRGSTKHEDRFIFLSGICSHPLGYAQSFAQAAAERGDMITLQGDVPCGGPYRKWSYDLPTIAKRIDAVLAAAGIASRDLTLIGYSQGAAIAERLIARYPGKFTRAVLMASPIVPSPARLHALDAAVFMAGTLDSQTNMRAGQHALEQAHIPVTFQPIPGARHGQMGNTPDATMASALGWLDENARGHVTPGDLVR